MNSKNNSLLCNCLFNDTLRTNCDHSSVARNSERVPTLQ